MMNGQSKRPAVCMLFAGTTEGRLFAEAVSGKEILLHIYVATSYGAELLPKAENIRIHAGRLDQEMLAREAASVQPDLVADATHPYAAAVTENLRYVCAEAGIKYLRIAGRKAMSGQNIRLVSSMKEAVSFLNRTQGNILFTTGSKEIAEVSGLQNQEERVYARVLPAVPSLALCAEAGIPSSHIIAMQGPFSEEMNTLQMKEKSIRWLVTKDSGEEGGCPEKCRAAQKTGAGIVMIGRPEEDPDAVSVEEAIRSILPAEFTDPENKNTGSPDTECDRLQNQNAEKTTACEISLVGLGPGGMGQLTLEAVDVLQRADILFGASRMLEMGRAVRKTLVPAVQVYRAKEIVDYLETHPEYRRAAVLYSGDISFCSGAGSFHEMNEKTARSYEVRTVSGISSVSYLLGRLGIPREETLVMSIHGRKLPVVPAVRANRYTAVLAGRAVDAGETADLLTELGMQDVLVTVGERLTYPEERIYSMRAEELAGRETEKLAVLVFENPNPVERPAGYGIADREFLRGSVPMTKRDVRAASLSRMNLSEHSVVWDVGAGTGSVSVEAALHTLFGTVYAIEQKTEALALIEDNRKKFGCGNLIPVCGTAPEVLKDLPAPDAVFIGGSSGKLIEILTVVFAKNPCADVVINAVSAETAAEIYSLRNALETSVPDQEVCLTEISVVGEQKAGNYHLRRAESPILICEIHKRAAKPES
ncbi:MAG: precorrin-6A reductase [Lachnospiraceae bacterium]|nr:precorrin-6A reductase [Lachnospiraceae bacterium]